MSFVRLGCVCIKYLITLYRHELQMYHLNSLLLGNLLNRSFKQKLRNQRLITGTTNQLSQAMLYNFMIHFDSLFGDITVFESISSAVVQIQQQWRNCITMTPSKNVRVLRIKVFLEIFQKRDQMHRRIQDPDKNLRWSALRQQLAAYSR